MRSGHFIALTTGKESNAGHGCRHGALEDAHGALGDFLYAGLSRAFFAGDHHRRFEHRAFERNAIHVERLVHGVQGPLGDLLATLNSVIAIHQHLRLDDGHQTRFLTNRRVARQRVCIGGDAGGTGDVRANVDHRAPLGKFCAELHIVRATLGQIIEALGHRFAGAERQRLGACIDLDARQHAILVQQINERGAIGGFLAQRFIVQNHTADVITNTFGGE